LSQSLFIFIFSAFAAAYNSQPQPSQRRSIMAQKLFYFVLSQKQIRSFIPRRDLDLQIHFSTHLATPREDSPKNRYQPSQGKMSSEDEMKETW
jgi:hypothetical protein